MVSRNNYGFAGAIRTGELRFHRDTAQLSLRTPPQTPPYLFFDCTTAARYIAADLQGRGVPADRIAIRSFRLPATSGGDPLQYLSHAVVVVKDGMHRSVIGVTPFDEVLGISPASDYSRWGCLARSIFLSEETHLADGQEVLSDENELTITKVAADSPMFESYPVPPTLCAMWGDHEFNPGAFLASQYFSPTSFPASRRLPPSVVETLTILIAPFWAGKYFGTTGLQMRFDSDGITLAYAAQVISINRGLQFSFRTVAQLGFNLCFKSRHFPEILEVSGRGDHGWHDFYNRLVELGMLARNRTIVFGDYDDPLFERPLFEALSRDWPVVAAFLRKLPDELISFPNP